MVEAALVYARRGWRVFPVEVGGKRPLGRLAPHGLKDATVDEAVIRGWWSEEPEANVAIATGPVSGLFVVDLDGPTGCDAYGTLLVEHGAVSADPGRPDGATVMTPGGGWHLFLALPEGVRIPNSAGRIAPGIDVRGHGGYVVAAPSVHPSGGRYVWRDAPPADHLPEPKDWIIEAIQRPPSAPRLVQAPAPVNFDGLGTAYGKAALRCELETLGTAVEGTRNHTLNAAAFAIGSLAVSGHLEMEAAVAELVRVAADIGLTEHEIRATIRSGLEAGTRAPRAAA